MKPRSLRFDGNDGQEIEPSFGINVALASSICAFVVERHLAEVNLELAAPTVVEIVKDVRVTFPDMLGTVGRRKSFRKVFFASYVLLFHNRRNYRPVHRPQPHQRRRNLLLGL